jgi:hypothetical protein
MGVVGTGGDPGFSGGNGEVVITATMGASVPEPGVVSLLTACGFGAVGILGSRRRRR